MNPSMPSTAAKDEGSSGCGDDCGRDPKQYYDEDSDMHSSDNSEKQKRRRKLKRARQGKKPHGSVSASNQILEASSDEDNGHHFSPDNNRTETVGSSGDEDFSQQIRSTVNIDKIGEHSGSIKTKRHDSPFDNGKTTSGRGRDSDHSEDSERRHDSPPGYESVTEAGSITEGTSIHTEPFSFEEVLLQQSEAERALGVRRESGSVAVVPPGIAMTDINSIDIPYTELEVLEDDQVHDFHSKNSAVDDESESSRTSQQWRQCPIWAPASCVLEEIQVDERSVKSKSSEGEGQVEFHLPPNEPGNDENFQARHGEAVERPILEISDSPIRRAIEPCTRNTAEREDLKLIEYFDLMNAESSRQRSDQPNQQGLGGSEPAVESTQRSLGISEQYAVAGSSMQVAGASAKSSQSGKKPESPQLPKIPVLGTPEGLLHYDRGVFQHSDFALRRASCIANSPLPRAQIEEKGYLKSPMLWRSQFRFVCRSHVGHSALENLGVGPDVHWRPRKLGGPLLTPEWLPTHPRGTRTWSMGVHADGYAVGMHTGVLDLSRPFQIDTDRRIIHDEMRLAPQEITIASDCIYDHCPCGLDGGPGHYGNDDSSPVRQEDHHRSQSASSERSLHSEHAEGCLSRYLSFLRQCIQPSSHVQDRPIPLRNLHILGRTRSRETVANTNALVTARDQSSLESSEEGTLVRPPMQVSRKGVCSSTSLKINSLSKTANNPISICPFMYLQ